MQAEAKDPKGFTLLRRVKPKSIRHDAAMLIVANNGKILEENFTMNCNVRLNTGVILDNCTLCIKKNSKTKEREIFVDGVKFETPRLSKTLFQFIDNPHES